MNEVLNCFDANPHKRVFSLFITSIVNNVNGIAVQVGVHLEIEYLIESCIIVDCTKSGNDLVLDCLDKEINNVLLPVFLAEVNL